MQMTNHTTQTIRELKIHPVAEMMPSMQDSEFQALVDSIRRDGQLIPIVTMDNQIIDGRHRYWACTELGITPITTEWAGTRDPAKLAEAMITANLQRRDVSPAQRAALAANAVEFFAQLRQAERDGQAGQADREPATDDPITHVASVYRAKKQYIKAAIAIRDYSDDLFGDLLTGDVSMKEALTAMRPPKVRPATDAAQRFRGPLYAWEMDTTYRVTYRGPGKWEIVRQ